MANPSECLDKQSSSGLPTVSMESGGADRGRFPLTFGGGNAPKTGGMDRRDPRVVVKTIRLRDDNLRNYHASLEAIRQQPCH
jgi:hypothetical protein